MSRTVLERLGYTWRIRWTILALTASALGGWTIGSFLLRLGWATTPATTAGWAAGLVLLAMLWLKRPPLTLTSVAHHLNRTLRQVQDSADLLVADGADLAPLERLQRARVESHLASATPKEVGPPGRLYHSPLAATLAAATLGLAVWLWPEGTGDTRRGPPLDALSRPAPSVTGTSIEVAPPAYTGRRASTVTDWNLEVLEGSRLGWKLTTDHQPDAVWLQLADEDSVAFGPSPGESGVFELEYLPQRSTVYRIVAARNSTRTTTGYHRLLLKPDLPPTITMLEPVERITLPADRPWRVTLRALADDDYGLGEPEIVATVASGYGEGVRFRDSVGRFTSVEHSDGTLRLREEIDLALLGMEPGDELYLYARVSDNRQPTANHTRTETVIIAIEDTATVIVSQPQGLAVDRMPDFFRSQRQIVIDTERLLSDRPGIDQQIFQKRSQNIGLDQYLLRLRYSELVGDEFEDMPLGLAEEDLEALGAESAAPTEPLPEVPVAQEGEENAPEDPVEGVRHEHDDPENATRLAATVKSTLKAALAEMWQAEVRLRTHRPADALPYELRALDLLKRVQQASRSYVLRTGFDPPPIDQAADRLTGTLDDVADLTRRYDQAGPQSDVAIRNALQVVQQLTIGAPAPPDATAILLAAGQALSRRALAEPVEYLAALGSIRTLVDSLSVGSSCLDCLPMAGRGLYRALPEPVPVRSDTRPVASGSARSYFDLLAEGR